MPVISFDNLYGRCERFDDMTFRDFIARVSNSPLGEVFLSRVWKLEDKLHRLIEFAQRHRAVQSHKDFYRRVREKFSDQQVRHGPFKGLRYASEGSEGSALVPKLLGSYENELHPWIETLREKDYLAVVDIGCAEGYYAIGLARLLPQAHVFAYDTNPAAREACARMADQNGVADRVTIGSFCSGETLRALDLPPRSLIICDCEGYETTLFDRDTTASLGQADLLIECHDLLGRPITRTLTDLFSDTHDVAVIETMPDHRKALELDLPELEGEPFPVRLYMVEEKRKAPQNFLILLAKG